MLRASEALRRNAFQCVIKPRDASSRGDTTRHGRRCGGGLGFRRMIRRRCGQTVATLREIRGELRRERNANHHPASHRHALGTLRDTEHRERAGFHVAAIRRRLVAAGHVIRRRRSGCIEPSPSRRGRRTTSDDEAHDRQDRQQPGKGDPKCHAQHFHIRAAQESRLGSHD